MELRDVRSLGELLVRFPEDVIVRIHRSMAVNLDRVTKVCSHMNGEFHLILNNGSSIKMSRSYKEKVKHFF